MPDPMDNHIPLKEFIEIHRLAHEKEHAKDMIAIERQWQEHVREHKKDFDVSELRALEHAAAHAREHTATELAIKKADDRIETRFEGVNEWRGQSKDQMATYARADDMIGRLKTQQEQINKLELWIAANAGVSTAITGLEAHVAVIEKQVTSSAARGGGNTQAVDWLFRGLAALAVIVGLYLALTGR